MSVRLEKINCLICAGSETEAYYTNVPDRFTMAEIYTEVQCRNCGFVYLSPRPAENEKSKFYDLEDYHPHRLSQTSLFDKLYHLVRKINSKNKRKLIQTFMKSGRLLDIGCGTGDFLLEMQVHDWSAHGLETAPQAREIAVGKDFPVSDELWKIEGRFDIITLWHVLEHVHRVGDLFDNIKRLLANDGYLLLAAPNRQSVDARYYARYWVALDAPRHLYHFRPEDIEKLLIHYGLEIIQSSSILYFDSWYNALLSAKLKAARENKSILLYLPAALIVALFSFIRGLINSKKCASPVYIARYKK
jgi:SAM-dependent methyltransferase